MSRQNLVRNKWFFFALISPVTFLFAASDLNQILVSEMWTNSDGQYLVQLDSKNSDTAWKVTEGHYYYFGNLSRPDIFQIYDTGQIKVTSMSGPQTFTMSILAPTSNNQSGEASLRLTADGSLTIRCPSKRLDLERATPEVRDQFQRDVQENQLAFHDLPESRKVQFVFQIAGTNTFIYVDAKEFKFSYDSFEMWIGAPGSMQPVAVQKISHFRNGANRIVTDLGTLETSQDPRTLPSYWRAPLTAPIQLELLQDPTTPRNDELLHALGIDFGRFDRGSFKSICE